MKRPLIAHQTPDRTRTQLLETHSRNVVNAAVLPVSRLAWNTLAA